MYLLLKYINLGASELIDCASKIEPSGKRGA